MTPKNAAAALLTASCATSAAAAEVRVMTFNVLSCQRGLEQVGAVIREQGADLVALQEVDKETRRSGGVDQAAALAAAAGLPHQRHFQATQLHGGPYGVALLSRFPLQEVVQVPLPTPPGQEPRTVARVTVPLPSGPASVYVTHLSHLPTNGEVRGAQARRILELMRADPNPRRILMGDLNDLAGSLALSTLTAELHDVFARVGRGPAGTFPLPMFLPAVTIDFVLASAAVRAVKSFVVRTAASDHHALVADLEL